jgi:hypothetical protein
MRIRRALVLIAGLSVLSSAMSGCSRGVHVAPLAAVPSGPLPEAKYVPALRYAPLAEGLLSVQRFKGVMPDGYSIEIRDVLVGPHKTSAAYAFPGATIVLVLGGAGSAALERRQTALRSGATFTVRERAPVSFVNAGDGGLTLRTITFTQVGR